jgi:hypothetical protein
MALSYETINEAFDFLAGLMSDLSFRTPNESMARAVWIAARHPRRKHRGVIVQFPADMEFPGPAKSKGPKPKAVGSGPCGLSGQEPHLAALNEISNKKKPKGPTKLEQIKEQLVAQALAERAAQKAKGGVA